jgi:uncharacterized caspase-like protein
MDDHGLYKPEYDNSYALVVGINKYKHSSPLAYASNDASEIARTLIDKFAFPETNVSVLLDGEATRVAIVQSYMKFTNKHSIGGNDRILFFFAGHGHTVGGRRETGFLIPADGKVDDLSSLIRWDEFTRNADLIPAKHMLFVMDACYGGLAVRRKAAPSGSMRFLQDLLQRYSRQVLAAGKPDQTVDDGGGGRPGHSIFTSHVLDALDGAAALSNGLITANSLMAYVYEQVGADEYSQQTPHYGSFQGDGDFVFDPSVVSDDHEGEQHDEREGNEILVKVAGLPDAEPSNAETLGQKIKALIPNSADKIKLDDLVSETLRSTLSSLGTRSFPTAPGIGDPGEQFTQRVHKYDEAIADLQIIVILLAHWGDPSHVHLLSKVFARLGERERPLSGSTIWLSLASYPVLALMYAGGVSALAANRYDMLKTCLLTRVRWGRSRREEPEPIIDPVVSEITSIINAFKALPEMQNKYVPRSEHQLAALQPIIEDQLFLGRSYEELFDQFEIMLALVYGDLNGGTISPFWGPPGRFAYKERSIFSGEKPFTAFVGAVKAQGDEWPGFAVGFFGGSMSRFQEVTDGYAKLIASINPFMN